MVAEDRSSDPQADWRALRARLAPRCEADGFLPFDRYMEGVLYDPEVGYYARARTPLGAGGDFYTAAHVDPLFGRAVAARARQVRDRLGSERRFAWVELGAGDGRLAATVAASLGTGRGEVEVVLIERSARRRSAALARVEEVAGPLGLRVRGAGSVAELGPFEGMVVANEVLDAQPVRRFLGEAGAWTELGVRLTDTGPVPASRSLRGPLPSLDARAAGAAGLVFETSPRAEALVREVADHLVRGLCVLFDYGDEEGELLTAHPRGTLAAVRGHRPLDDPLTFPGDADLSAFVNFGRIRAAARRAGLHEVAYRTQAEALVAWGLETLLSEEVARAGSGVAELRLRLAAKNLLFGFGTFRALELAAGGFVP